MNGLSIDDIEFFESEDGRGPAKATVHKSGRLGFSSAANKLMALEVGKAFKIGRKKVDANDNGSVVLFMIPAAPNVENTFKVNKAGNYYSIKAKRLLNQLGIDYRDELESIIFDIDELGTGDNRYYRLTRKQKKAKLNTDTQDNVA